MVTMNVQVALFCEDCNVQNFEVEVFNKILTFPAM